jgi:hypothetical protein
MALGYGQFSENKNYYVVKNEAGLYLCEVLPGFPRKGVEPVWDHIDFAFRFNENHAQTQVNLLGWDYKQRATKVRKSGAK